MVDTATMAKLLQSFQIALNAHDRENPEHTSWGIGMSHFDIERLDLEEGETLVPGIVLHNDGGTTGNFRILCDGDHDSDEELEAEESVDAVAADERGEPVIVEVGGYPEPLRPPV
jgi:hypothetical protein